MNRHNDMEDRDYIIRTLGAIAEENGAELAILFGSYGRGTASRRSDVDVIFVEQTDDPFLRRIDRYLSPIIDRLRLAADVFVYTPKEFMRMRESFFVRKAISDGVVVFERRKVS